MARRNAVLIAGISLTIFINSFAANASPLSDMNAFACGATDTSVSGTSTAVGSRIQFGAKKALAGNANQQFKSIVKMKMTYNHGDFSETEHCGGTVIASRWIVTAAHCLQGPEGDDTKWDRIEIMAGDRTLGGSTAISRVATNAVCHAGFDYAYLSNDIALVKVDEPFPREIVPARMDTYRRPSVSAGGIAQAAGWPVTGPKAGQKTLQTLALAVKKVEWPGYITVTSPSGHLEGVCRGESGGPLIGMSGGNRQLAGILSGIETGTEDKKGEPCMKVGYEMYFTPIAAYRNWIDKVQNNCDTDPDSCRNDGGAEFFLREDTSTKILAETLREEFGSDYVAMPTRVTLTPSGGSNQTLCMAKGGSIGQLGAGRSCDMPDGMSYPLDSLKAFGLFQ